MHSYKISTVGIVFAFVVLAVASIALADDIYNNIDGSIDATLESINLTVGGPNGGTSFFVNPTKDDGKNGCNLTGSKTLTVSVGTSDGSVATVSPTSLTFGSCGDIKPITVTAVGAGTATISLTQTNNATAGTFNLAPASFTVNVSAPPPADTTAPDIQATITPEPNGSGWNNSDVTVIWTVNDAESTITSQTGCDSSALTDETAGTTLTCTATSAGGTASKSVTVKIDKTKPVISGSRTPAANANGWNNESVEVSFSCTEVGAVQSGIATNTVAGATVDGEGEGQSVANTGECTDAAGNAAVHATVSDINIDLTAPSASATSAPGPNGNGWNNTSVVVSFSGSDALSGIDNCAAPVSLDSEGAGQSASGTCIDKAGNVSAPAGVSGINIDKTAASIVITTPTNTSYTFHQTISSVFSCSDALSGVATCSGPSTLDTSSLGGKTFTVNATDNAENASSASVNYSIVGYTFGGFTSPLTISAKDWKKNSTIPVKFRLTDTFGNSVSNAVATSITVKGVSATPTGGTVFRYDASVRQYIFNLSTKSVSLGSNLIEITLDDGSTLKATVVIR